MSIFRQSLILICIPLATQLVFLAMLLVIRADQRQAQRWALHTSEVIAQAEACQRSIVEAQAHLRGLALTGLPSFVQQYDRSRKGIPEAFAALGELAGDNTTQRERVQEMVRLADELIAFMDEVARLAKSGRRADVERRVRTLDGERLMRQLNELTTDFLAEERQLDSRRQQNLSRAMQFQDGILFAGGFLAIAGSGGLLVAFRKGLGRRLRVLSDNTRRVAEGQALALPLRGDDELGRLDAMFHRMVDTIRQKEQENELFVYSVSHDLRSPLVNLQGFSQELSLVLEDLRGLVATAEFSPGVKERTQRLLDRDAAEAIRFIQSAVTRLAGIIDSLLRLSRVGRVEYRCQTVDVAATVRRIVASMQDSLTQRGAVVEIHELPSCWGDPGAIDQVFANLIGNAINYLDPGRPGRIEIGCHETADSPSGLRAYYVRDNGMGIPEALQPKVFVAFQRLHPELAPGEGIGLAVVRRVAERHGGKVWVESITGVGSTFYVALPSEQSPLPAGQVAVTPNSRAGTSS